jgi:hypothetical protein
VQNWVWKATCTRSAPSSRARTGVSPIPPAKSMIRWHSRQLPKDHPFFVEQPNPSALLTLTGASSNFNVKSARSLLVPERRLNCPLWKKSPHSTDIPHPPTHTLGQCVGKTAKRLR